MRENILTVLAVSSLCLIGISACSQQGQGESVSQASREALLGYLQDRSGLEQAMVYEQERCMEQKGFTADISTDDPGPSLVGVAGLFADEQSAERGYSETVVQGVEASDDEEYQKALFGADEAPTVDVTFSGGATVSMSTEGCTAESAR